MITFAFGDESISVPNPQYGYDTEIIMPITYSRLANRTYGHFDAGATYDVRICRGLRFLFNVTYMALFAEFFKNALKGRGNQITLSLGETPSGFFPFGPDKGDTGDFVIDVVSYDPGSQLQTPYKYWSPAIEFSCSTYPDYTYTDDTDQGQIVIGSITGIKYPPYGYNATSEYQISNVVLHGGEAKFVDAGIYQDTRRTSFTVSANQGKMAAIVDECAGTIRGANNIFQCPTGNYPFGPDVVSNLWSATASGGKYDVKYLYSKVNENNVSLVVTHDRFDQFLSRMNMVLL